MKNEEDFSKCLSDIVLCLIILQVIFLGIKQIAFQLMVEALFSRSMVTMVSMIVGIIFLCAYKRRRSIKVSALPVKFGKIYFFATFLTILFFVITLFFIRGFSLQIVTALFGLWHIGYAVGIYLWQGGNMLRCIVMKVLWGTMYGLFLGAIRLKTKNCYPGILAHGVLNVFG